MVHKALTEKQKVKHRKGLWSPEEDQILRNYVLKYGHGCWSSVPINAGLERNGKSCRLRWINYLRPGLKKGIFTIEEEDTILTLHRMLGNKWSQMAQHLPGRTDNEIKNYWHSYLKKRVSKTEQESKNNVQSTNSNSDNSIESFSTSPNNYPDHINSEGSPVKTIQSSKEEANKNPSPLPKIMFAEWLSLDTFASLGYGDGGGENELNLMANSNSFHFDHQYSSYQDNGLFQMNEGLMLFGHNNNNNNNYDHYHNYSLSDGSVSTSNQMCRFDGQSTTATPTTTCNDQFVDFSSGDDICSGFNMSNDVMFM